MTLIRLLQALWRSEAPILDEEEIARLAALRRIHERGGYMAPQSSDPAWAQKLLEEDAAKVNA